MKKQILLLVIMLLSTLAVFPANVEINGIWYLLKGQQGIVISSQGQKYSGNIVIPSVVEYEGTSYDITSIGEGAFNNCTNLQSVSIPNTVNFIGHGAFSHCSGLVSVNIPDGVTSIEDDTFSVCSSLTSISIPNSVLSIGEYAFLECANLTSVTIGNGLKKIKKRAFDACPIESLYISNLKSWCEVIISNNTAVPNNKHFFVNGQEINHLVIPDDITAVNNYSFEAFRGLKTVVIPNSVTTIGTESFSGCQELESITIGNNVKSIGNNAFHSCRGLTTINLPQNLELIDLGAFAYCEGLASVIIPNNVTTIGKYAFTGCNKMNNIVIGEHLNYLGEFAFSECPELMNVYCYPKSLPSTAKNAFQDSYINSATLHVPSSSINLYKSSLPWKDFGNIIELTESDPNPTGIDMLKSNKTEEIKAYYNIDGKRINKLQKGVNIVHMSDGTTSKVVVK